MEEVPDFDKILDKASKLGADFCEIRYTFDKYERISIDNGNLSEYSSSYARGVGIKAIKGGSVGFSSTTSLLLSDLLEAVERAVKLAEAGRKYSKKHEFEERPTERVTVQSDFRENPFDVPPEEKIEIMKAINSSAEMEGIKSRITVMGNEDSLRLYLSSDGAEVQVRTITTGISHISIAFESGKLERVSDSKSYCRGYEFIREHDWEKMAKEVSEIAKKAVNARCPPPGTYSAVISPRLIGLLLHEAFGHASEGDEVYAEASVLKGMLGKKVASEIVTIYDEGIVEGGYFFPYDDEGVKKGRTVVVDKGILKSHLTSREMAKELSLPVTGNARAQNFSYDVLVRQTNFYMAPGDMSEEELIEGVKEGIYVTEKGSRGGEVNPVLGTFTFSGGFSWRIKNGELVEPLRGVTLSGMILDVLRSVDGVGKEVVVNTSVFGGCGKEGQRVRVGVGGPAVRVRRITIGGM